jgi:Tol biopolymer transport system component
VSIFIPIPFKTMIGAGVCKIPRPRIKAVIGLLIMVAFPQLLFAQFYNGSQLTFGKNRVQYTDFLWTYFRYDKFDTYFYLNGKELATYTAEYADKHIKEIETTLQSTLEEKVQFIIFNSLSDLKQSNIGLVGDWDSYNTGGVTRIIGGKVLLYFDGNYDHFEQQIRAGIVTVILNEMIYGTGIGAQIKNNAIFNMPEWYLNGLITYISQKWNTDIDNVVKDAILHEKYAKFNRLTGLEAANAGHSLWNYIALKYGESSIPNIVYMARLSRNVEKGFLYVLGISFNNLVAEWLAFYKNIYESDNLKQKDPEGNKIVKKPGNESVYDQMKIRPDGQVAAYCTHRLGIHKVFLQNLETGKKRKIYRGGYRIEEKPDYSFPLLTWHPSGKILAMVTERKGGVYLYFYSVDDRSFEKRILSDFTKILDISYSDDGSLLVLSAIRKGQSDIFVYNIIAGSYFQVTNDLYDDLNPRFIFHSQSIIFSSDRISDTIRFNEKVPVGNRHFGTDLFLYDFMGKKNVLKRITHTSNVNEIQPMPYDDRYFSFLSDQNGIYNRYLARFDSSIAYIDTATHYRYYTRAIPVTNYAQNILEQDMNPSSSTIGQLLFRNGQYEMRSMDKVIPTKAVAETLSNTFYENLLEEASHPERIKAPPDSTKNTPEVIYRSTKKKHFTTVMQNEVPGETPPGTGGLLIKGQPHDSLSQFISDTSSSKFGPIRIKAGKDTTNKYEKAKALNYYVEYSIDQMVTQVDFTYLNSAYQPYTGSKESIWINPGLNALLMVGITDLMEDHRITGGVRLNFNLVNNEYLLSYTNQRRRLDHQIVFHRQSIEESGYYSYIRHRVHELYYIVTYPFTPVLNIRGTATIRYDRAVYLSTDQYNLKQPDVDKVWGSIKGELTYDNTRNVGLNLYNGTRYKIFGEYYQMVNASKNNIIILGADFRHYLKIHRTMILALRFAASTSFGSNKLLYYMGGVDNWLFPTFNTSTSVATDQNYAFQTLATNMRGFSQNIRNGNSFFVINAEIRLPAFRYFYNRPIRSDFLNNFQIVGFGDLGTAWTGLSPYSEDNQLFTTYISRNPLFIKVEMMKEPIVEGIGFGLRSRLFGYFLRGDVAWGIEDGKIRKPVYYLSLSLDF